MWYLELLSGARARGGSFRRGHEMTGIETSSDEVWEYNLMPRDGMQISFPNNLRTEFLTS